MSAPHTPGTWRRNARFAESLRVRWPKFAVLCALVVVMAGVIVLRAQQPAQKQTLFPALEGHTYSVAVADYTPDGKLVATASFDRTVKIWDAAGGKELRTLTGHAGQILALDVSSDGRYILTGARDNTLKLWDMFRPKPLVQLSTLR